MRIPPAALTLALSIPLALGACGGGDDSESGGSFESGGEHFDVAGDAWAVAAQNDIVYVSLGTTGAIAQLNQSAKTTEPPIPVGPEGTLISDIEISPGAVWAADNDGGYLSKVLQADPADAQVVPIKHTINDIEYTEQGIWTAGAGQATRVDPTTLKPGDPINTPALSEEIAVEAGTVWLPGTTDDGYVERVAVDTGEVNTQPLTIGTQPDPVDSHAGFVWIGDEKEEVLRKVDAKTGQVAGETKLGAFPSAVAAGPGGVFVLSEADRITRIDPASGQIAGTRKILGNVRDIAVDGNALWIAEGTSGLTKVPLD